MNDFSTKLSPTQDDPMLDPGDESSALPTGEDTPELESGDDLAQKALAQANQNQLSSTTSARLGANNDAAQIAETLVSLQNIIERNANELDLINDELKTERESLKNIFENDVELSEAEEQASVVTQKLKERKSKVQSSPQVMQLKTKIGDLQEKKKEILEALNNHLLNYYQVTGAKIIDTSDGQQREFEVRASMKGKKKSE